ncbi:MAG: cytochrome b/b6 domain-containing protein [Magnetococcales bacterium]|nr:cytochrome b/b6 domain-containing protein [Magnetococcales bacterium]
MSYDRLTRLLHLFIATTILAQLMGSLLMIQPKPGRPGDTFYAMHEIGGQVILGLLLAHWIWCLIRAGTVPFPQVFPWFSRQRCQAVHADLKHHLQLARQWRLPDSREPTPLASAVQGIGLSVATLLGVSGLLLDGNLENPQAMTGWLHTVKEGHEVLGNLLWLYLALHAGMAILHQLTGHGGLRAMVLFWEKDATTKSC